MKRSAHQLLAVVSLSVALISLNACVALQINKPIYKITTHDDFDKLGYQWSEDTVYFFLSSDKGVGHAEVTRTGGAVPNHIVFNIYFKGLENFSITYGQTQGQVSITSVTAPALVESGPVNGKLLPVTSDSSPFWMPVRIVASMPSIPMTNGYFEVTAPPDMISTNPESFTINWVDFYR